jgi:hypothetical protein
MFENYLYKKSFTYNYTRNFIKAIHVLKQTGQLTELKHWILKLPHTYYNIIETIKTTNIKL